MPPTGAAGFARRARPRALAVAAVLLAVIVPSASASASGTAEPPAGPPPTPVRVAAVREEPLAPRRRVFGELRAVRQATIAAEEGGIVREMLLREGVRAAKGDLLAQLDDGRVRLEIEANRATRAAAEAAIGERRANVVREERDLDLLRRAAAEGGTNPRELSDAESALHVARAQLLAAEAAVGVIERQGALLERRLADLSIRAPFAGTVTRRHAEQGAWIAAGGAVVDLVATDALEAWFDVPQELLAPARALAERPVAERDPRSGVVIETASGSTIVARSMRVVPSIDPRARTFVAVVPVEASASELAGELAAGLALAAYVPAGASAPRLVVPKDAILRGDAGPYVFAVRDGVAVPVPVRIAFPLGDSVALETSAQGGLAAGAEVVVEGNERLVPMSPVAPVAPAAPAAGADAGGKDRA